MKYIDIANIGFKYESEPVLENISFQVSAGEFIILTGENGAAKSTLLRIILGILQPDKGSVTFAKKERRWRATFDRLCTATNSFI